MNTEPDITVLMPVRNGMPHVRDAVQSILSQTLSNIRLLVVDDGSEDDTVSCIRGLDDGRIEIHHRPPLGVGAALNYGLEHVSTQFVARMDADDISLPTRLERQLRFACAHPEVGMLGCRIAFTVDGRRYGCAPPLPLTHEDIVAVLRAGGHAISHPAVLWRTDVILAAGGYRVQGAGQDWDMFFRVSEITRVANIPEIAYLMRLHPSSLAWSSRDVILREHLYACECAARRRRGLPEPLPDEFAASWIRRPWCRRIDDRLRIHAEVMYRRAIFCRLTSRFAEYVLCLLLAALASPRKTVTRIRKASMLKPAGRRSQSSP